MTNRFLSILVAFFFSISPAANASEADLGGAIGDCRAISDDGERLTCYDAIDKTAAQPIAASNDEILEKLGAEQLPRSDEQRAEENTSATAYVTRCTRAHNKKYIFYLESGQVWRQKSEKRLRFKECNFQVEISRDMFGYRMSKVGETSRIRVARIR